MTGRVLRSGEPVAGVRVFAAAGRAGSPAVLDETESDADGRFELRGAEPGPAEVEVRDGRWRWIALPVEVPTMRSSSTTSS
jgi:hypothetical protein